MRLLAGFLPIPDDAKTSVRVAGLDARSHSRRLRQEIGYLPEQVPLYPELRVREHLSFRAAIKGVPRRERAIEVARVASLVAVESMLDVTIGRLSRGYRQRVGIADALLGQPPLVVLDEPTVGLDPNQVVAIRECLRHLGGAQTLIFSSHVLMDVEALCDRILILSRGTLAADEPVHGAGSISLVVEWDGEVRSAASAALRRAYALLGLGEAPDQLLTTTPGRTHLVLPHPPSDLAAAVGRASLLEGVAVTRLEYGRARLEERFARVTGFRGAGGAT
jgi:ABC-2 type transport system ATP-binding protein